MANLPVRGPCRGGRLAFVFSLALHVAAGLAVLFLPRRDNPEPPPRPLAVDAVLVRLEEPNDPDNQPLTTARGQGPRSEEPPEVVLPEPAGEGGEPEPISSLPSGPGPSSRGRPKTGWGPRSPTPEPGAGFGGGGAGTVCQVQAQARSVVYVIDRSMSMGLGGLDAARRELLASLARLSPAVRFQVIVYNRAAQPLPLGGQTGLAPATENNKRAAADLLQSVVAEGGTDHPGALRRALALQPDVIFLLTDADDFREDEARAITRINHQPGRTPAALHAIRLDTAGTPRESTALAALAGSNHGTLRVISLTPVP